MHLQLNEVLSFFAQLEGTYKWYVVGIFLILITALVTRYIFKTIKWFFLLVSLIVVIIAVMQYVFNFNPLTIFQKEGIVALEANEQVETETPTPTRIKP